MNQDPTKDLYLKKLYFIEHRDYNDDQSFCFMFMLLPCSCDSSRKIKKGLRDDHYVRRGTGWVVKGFHHCTSVSLLTIIY